MQDPETLSQSLEGALALKEVARAGWLRAGIESPESVAAHSWGVAWLVLALCPADVDRGRALAIAVLHDLAEARVGDITPYDGVGREEKRRLEESALGELLSSLPHGAELFALWREYEDGTSPEGRFVKACDRLDMGLQALRYGETGKDTAEFLRSARVDLPGELASLLRR